MTWCTYPPPLLASPGQGGGGGGGCQKSTPEWSLGVLADLKKRRALRVAPNKRIQKTIAIDVAAARLERLSKRRFPRRPLLPALVLLPGVVEMLCGGWACCSAELGGAVHAKPYTRVLGMPLGGEGGVILRAVPVTGCPCIPPFGRVLKPNKTETGMSHRRPLDTWWLVLALQRAAPSFLWEPSGSLSSCTHGGL